MLIGMVILAMFFGFRAGGLDGLADQWNRLLEGEFASPTTEDSDTLEPTAEEVKQVMEAEKEVAAQNPEPEPVQTPPDDESAEADTTQEAPPVNRAFHELYIRKRDGLLEYQLNGKTFPSLMEALEGVDMGKKFIVRLSGNISMGREKELKAQFESHHLDYTIQEY